MGGRINGRRDAKRDPDEAKAREDGQDASTAFKMARHIMGVVVGARPAIARNDGLFSRY
jgi:hypothetical protein